jgi:uncharacterized protein (DUF2141 family)
MNRRTIRISQVAAAIFAFLLWAPFPPLTAQIKDTATLTVRVTGARNTKGKIGVTLFQDAQGFPDDTSKAVRQQSVEIDPNSMTAQVTFKDLPQGTFAVSVLHDENGNGKLDKNFVGMPKEGYARANTHWRVTPNRWITKYASLESAYRSSNRVSHARTLREMANSPEVRWTRTRAAAPVFSRRLRRA